MTETRRLQNEEFFTELKSKDLKTTKSRRNYLIDTHKANDIAKKIKRIN